MSALVKCLRVMGQPVCCRRQFHPGSPLLPVVIHFRATRGVVTAARIRKNRQLVFDLWPMRSMVSITGTARRTHQTLRGLIDAWLASCLCVDRAARSTVCFRVFRSGTTTRRAHLRLMGVSRGRTRMLEDGALHGWAWVVMETSRDVPHRPHQATHHEAASRSHPPL